MTAVDTNVIVRYLVADDPGQAEAARSLLEQLTPDNPGFICSEVVIEAAWVLERSYRFPSCSDCRSTDGPDCFG